VYVDLYAPSAKWQQKVWSSGVLADTTHTVTIEWTGNKNASATDSLISVDAFDLVGEITTAPLPSSTLIQEDNPNVGLYGTWTSSANASLSGGAHAKSGRDSYTTMSFTGTSISWIAMKAAGYGIAKVTLDGGTPQYVDLYSSNTKWQQHVWSVSGLADTTHTVDVDWTGTKNSSATDSALSLDAFEIVGELLPAPAERVSTTVVLEETDPSILYTGLWTSLTSSSLSSGTLTKASTESTVSVAFTGTGIDWIALKSSSYGVARVTLDEGAPVDVDLYSATARWKDSAWSVNGLSPGAHTLTISWTGEKNAAATTAAINVDAFRVTP